MLWVGPYSQQAPLAALLPGGDGWKACLGTGRQGPNFPTSTHSEDPAKKQTKMHSGEEVSLGDTGGNQANNVYLCWVCPGRGKHSTSPFPFPQLQEPFWGWWCLGPP